MTCSACDVVLGKKRTSSAWTKETDKAVYCNKLTTSPRPIKKAKLADFRNTKKQQGFRSTLSSRSGRQKSKTHPYHNTNRCFHCHSNSHMKNVCPRLHLNRHEARLRERTNQWEKAETGWMKGNTLGPW